MRRIRLPLYRRNSDDPPEIKRVKQVVIRAGEAVIENVPAPQVSEKNLLVAVSHSCVSTGTEMAGVRLSALPLYRRALVQPSKVAQALQMVKDKGVRHTLDRVRGKLAAGFPTGYSAAGRVLAMGDQVEGFSIGDRVACSGSGIANHAERIDVPVNLAVRIPDEVSDPDASTVTLGAIALQGVRRADLRLGETVGVLGLGLVGQLTAQLLKASGCRVIGFDLDPRRVQLALEGGIDHGVDPNTDDFVTCCLRHSDGFGLDAVLVTAATPSNEPIHQAMQACRKKARVIIVGDIGLDLQREDLYKKELDLVISTASGPGRYDPVYEISGQDYPLPYVRWTENRNMESYLDLMARNRIRIDQLPSREFPIDQVKQAYRILSSGDEKPLLVTLNYPERDDADSRRVNHSSHRVAKKGQIRVALVGAGGFAQGVHLPNLEKLHKSFVLHSVMNRTGSTAVAVAQRYQARYSTTDYEEILADPEVDLVLIATRHDLHGPMTLAALERGKHVFVEKPLALHEKELGAIEELVQKTEKPPYLMTGFNRRFSPAIRCALKILSGRQGPMMINYRMNVPPIPKEHWTQGPEGGGRNLGEACHLYDLFGALTQSTVDHIRATLIGPPSGQVPRDNNFVSTIRFTDGSVGTLTYTTLGSQQHSKEQMEIFSEGKVLVLDDYRTLQCHGSRHHDWKSNSIEKGQMEELESLASYLLGEGPCPMTVEEQLQASRIALEVERQIRPAPISSD